MVRRETPGTGEPLRELHMNEEMNVLVDFII